MSKFTQDEKERNEVINDCLVDLGIEPTDTNIQKVIDNLSDSTKGVASEWGWDDTVVSDDIFVLIRDVLIRDKLTF